MPKHIPLPLPLLIIALSACISAAAEPKHDIVPEGEYPSWPADSKVPVVQIEAAGYGAIIRPMTAFLSMRIVFELGNSRNDKPNRHQELEDVRRPFLDT